jgi:glycopeptide antibiotics resistance protein
MLTLITLLLTLVPTDALGNSKLWSYDKLGHMILFGSWSFILGLYFQIRKSSSVNLWVIFASGATFGLLIEILQHLLPLKRQGDPVDLLFDILGCLAAIWILYRIQPRDSE